MNTPNDESKGPDNMELLKQQAAACGPGCGCHANVGSVRMRWVIGAIVLVAAGAMVVRAVTKGNGSSAQAPEPAFAAPAVAPAPPVESSPAASTTAATKPEEVIAGTSIGALAELNVAAAGTDGVFIFLPAKAGNSGNPPSTTMKGAARIIEAQGYKIGLFTLKAGARDYDEIAKQMSVPGVLAIVKGAGMSPISGDITETKLVQGFVAASRAGGCGTGGCAPSGCK